ncbi:MAG: hypothetical protein IPK23_14790 [Rhizobiales bacterium]|nr:hypothetical protein [Hyphomicrobiales bacterium]
MNRIEQAIGLVTSNFELAKSLTSLDEWRSLSPSAKSAYLTMAALRESVNDCFITVSATQLSSLIGLTVFECDNLIKELETAAFVTRDFATAIKKVNDENFVLVVTPNAVA